MGLVTGNPQTATPRLRGPGKVGGSIGVAPRKPRLWPLRVLLALADLYAIALVAYFVLRLLFGDRLWPVALAGVFLPWLLLPALLLLPAMLLLRRRPAVLLGDFNLVDQSDNYRLLTRAGLTDAFRAAGWGFGATWPIRGRPFPGPLLRIDSIWVTARFQASRAWVGPDGGSDHLPVLAELRW